MERRVPATLVLVLAAVVGACQATPADQALLKDRVQARALVIVVDAAARADEHKAAAQACVEAALALASTEGEAVGLVAALGDGPSVLLPLEVPAKGQDEAAAQKLSGIQRQGRGSL